MHHFWGCVQQAEAERCRAAGAGGAAKVDDSPAVLAGQPHHVGGLEVAVHVACIMEALKPLREVLNHLHELNASQREIGVRKP